MARKKQFPEPSNHERWLVSYADFITLLFACFVVMFAASNSDQKKAGQVAKAVQDAFKRMAVFTPAGKVIPLYDSGGLPSDDKTAIGNTYAGFDATQLVNSAGPGDGGKVRLSDVKAQLQTILKDEISNRNIHISEDSSLPKPQQRLNGRARACPALFLTTAPAQSQGRPQNPLAVLRRVIAECARQPQPYSLSTCSLLDSL